MKWNTLTTSCYEGKLKVEKTKSAKRAPYLGLIILLIFCVYLFVSPAGIFAGLLVLCLVIWQTNKVLNNENLDTVFLFDKVSCKVCQDEALITIFQDIVCVEVKVDTSGEYDSYMLQLKLSNSSTIFVHERPYEREMKEVGKQIADFIDKPFRMQR